MEKLSINALRLFAGVGQVDLWSPSTALLIVDMQVSCVRPHGYTLQRLPWNMVRVAPKDISTSFVNPWDTKPPAVISFCSKGLPYPG